MQATRNRRPLLTLVLLLMPCFALTACEDGDVEDAAEDVEDAAEDAADSVEDAVDDVVD